ncbi:hypothetical protein DPMN_170414 [Dreissena polymorpha]|uniref:Uncharacterized protein n=1 Tax=Dreissena polymorpha TaxID=45954 RepID=A0A9D4DYJ2_DREPO|nr:hypothetical protein DPMN_170414 [Dreissena polymorpha]
MLFLGNLLHDGYVRARNDNSAWRLAERYNLPTSAQRFDWNQHSNLHAELSFLALTFDPVPVKSLRGGCQHSWIKSMTTSYPTT